MYKIILAALLVLVACSTTTNLDNRVKTLESQMKSVHYNFVHEKCFINYNKCMVENKKDCWKNHESCVIRAYKTWKPLLD